MPLAIKSESRFLLPSIYGVGTGLPVLVFSVLIAFGVRRVGKAFNRVKQVEFWVRRATGVVFIAIGLYYALKYIFKVI